jgi:hypothetical protein
MAIIDRRELEFDGAALLDAVATSQKAAESFGLPGMVPRGVRFYPHEGEVAFLYGTPQTPRAVRLSAEATGALLVSYCIRAKIPMPRKAEKRVRINAHCVILTFRLDFCQSPKAIAESSQIRAAAPVASWTWVEPNRDPPTST